MKRATRAGCDKTGRLVDRREKGGNKGGSARRGWESRGIRGQEMGWWKGNLTTFKNDIRIRSRQPQKIPALNR